MHVIQSLPQKLCCGLRGAWLAQLGEQFKPHVACRAYLKKSLWPTGGDKNLYLFIPKVFSKYLLCTRNDAKS